MDIEMKKLRNKVAIVTGGTGGLGISVVEELLAQGAAVVCTYYVESELRSCIHLVKENKSKIMFLKTDLTREKQVKKMVDKTVKAHGRVDILINLVGGFVYSELLETEAKTFDQMLNINLKTVFNASKAVLPHMIERNYGRVVNVSSRPALKGAKGVGAYSASKAAVLNLTETLAEEMLDYDININAILPGTIDTPANRNDMADADFARWVTPAEIAKVIIFLASDDSKPITGAGIPVFGRS